MKELSLIYYMDSHSWLDIKIESLLYFKDIKNWIIYMHKDIYIWNYTGSLSCLEMYRADIFMNRLGDIYWVRIVNPIIKIKIALRWLIVSIKSLDKVRFDYFCKFYENIKIEDNIRLKEYKNSLNIVNVFFGVKLTHNKIDQRTLINILQYYLILNEYYIYNDNIYEKIKDSKISYKLVGNLVDILYNKFQENVILFFLNNFENYFKGFDFSYLLDNFFIKNKNVIESIKDLSTQRIEPNFGLIEFTDGIYSIKYDRFISKKHNCNFLKKLSTIKYYNKSYNWIRQNKPYNWIGGLKNALNIKNNELINENYVRLCLHMVVPIHKDLFFNKKSTLFIYGESNTGKTTLISNVLSDYFGSENIGSIISAKNFKWQDLIGKILGIIDEGRYNSSMSSDLLKITGQENIIIEKKYSKEHIVINPIPLIILTNTLFEDKNKLIDEALKNRLYMIEFINKISKENLKNSNKFKNILKNEEANIIVYCNKLLFKIKENNLKIFSDKISNEKIIECIYNNK